MTLEQYKHIHFVGIGGAGMSAIAWVLVQRGFSVSGSDPSANEMTKKLAALGVRIDARHEAKNIRGADLVVTSTAIPPANPERQAAERDGVPIWRRAKALAAIMALGRSIAVCGTHGKTTTTTMLGMMLSEAGLDPTVLVGGHVNDFGGNARLGKGEWVVAEADESDASFLEMRPDRIVLTNIEADHLDFYANLAEVKNAFEQFVGHLREGGKLIACIDDPHARELVEKIAAGKVGGPARPEVITYGLDAPDADMRADSLAPGNGNRGTGFTPIWRGTPLPPMTLRIPGKHNVLNSLGALACGLDIDADREAMCRALTACEGAKRRYQIKGEVGGVTIVDDYAHHPTEIRATLAAACEDVARGRARRVVALFQPHRYSRTRALAGDFGFALLAADLVVVTDVYSAGEPPLTGVTGRLIHDALIKAGHQNAFYLDTLDAARDFLLTKLQPNDLLLTLGAGNVWQVGEWLLEQLSSQRTRRRP
jgi:UDP-N-acetylmuramate--alanine ligase